MHFDRHGAASLWIVLPLLAVTGGANADELATPKADAQLVPMETVVSGDCWGNGPMMC
ncbi:hypothetical protein [Xanthomonas cannabis]|uniref:hypothetical protein n=1 Tax=Xanthomonas cannabis TaxID=1885674 RepID=UPI001FB99788|nr:hypothetical protein [Xanthomonas cannabis]NIK20721.1 hypothetical protein [Xanthomonas cannabis]